MQFVISLTTGEPLFQGIGFRLTLKTKPIKIIIPAKLRPINIYAMKKEMYIITGANGHLASTIIRQLSSRDCLVRGLILPSEDNVDKGNVSYFKGDITVRESMSSIFSGSESFSVTVIHAAGIVSIADEMTPQLYNVNFNGTLNVISCCFEHEVRRLVYVSSVHALDEGDGLSVITEATSFAAGLVDGAYAKTKAIASQAVLEAVNNGLDAVIVHPSGIVGPYDDGRNHIVQFVKQYMEGRIPGGVRGGYDFVDVRDVARGCLLAAERGCSGECYILSNRYVTVRDIIRYVSRATGRREVHCYPMWLAKSMAPLFELAARIAHRRPLFTRYALRTLVSNGRFTHDKATMQLGYSPMDPKDSFHDTVMYLKGELI